MEKYIELIRELGCFPLVGEIKIKRKSDETFPSENAFRQLGSKQERAQTIIEFCEQRSGFDDVISCCVEVAESPSDKPDELLSDANNVGYVYLIKHGSRSEYKIGRTNNPLRREGEIRLELPEQILPIHYIETDDPAGIENYWHSRFAEKRKKGEWFSLTVNDVRAFKRWRKIY